MVYPGNIIPIAEARMDADMNYSPDKIDEEVEVVGVVTSVNIQTTRFSYFIQDASAAINIFKSDEVGPALKMGDRVVVKGLVAQYAGTTEIIINDLTTDLMVIDSNRVLTAKTLTIPQLLADPEMYESMRINLVGFAPVEGADAWPAAGLSANIDIWDGADYLIFRVDSDTDLDDNPEPAWPVSVTGIATQFTFSDPANDGYQITGILYSDILQGIAIPPNPKFALLSPPDSAVVSITDSTESWEISWQPSVDLNGDPVVYQWGVLPDFALNKVTSDTTLIITAEEVLGVMSDLGVDTLTIQWTVKAKGAEDDFSTSIYTHTLTFINDIVVGVEDGAVPLTFYVDQNYPNPFNPTTTIQFGVPNEAAVDLRIFDVLGQQVAVLLNREIKKPGNYNLEFNAGSLASGTYFFRLQYNDNVITKKMLLLK